MLFLGIAAVQCPIKALLRAAAARTIDDWREAIRLALGAFTPNECQNYFAAAGYDAS